MTKRNPFQSILLRLVASVVSATVLQPELYFDTNTYLPAVRPQGWGLSSVLLVAGLYLLFRFAFRRQFRWEVAGLALFFALCTLIGESYQAFGEWTLLFGGLRYLPYALCSLAGCSLAYYALMILGAAGVRRLMHTSWQEGPWGFLFDRHPLLCAFVLILICEIPYMLALFPGIVSFDGSVQIAQGMRWEHFTWHHPPLTSYFYAFWATRGLRWDNKLLGIFCIVVCQSLLAAWAFARSLCCMKRLRTPYPLRLLTLLFYALYPVWPTWAMTVIKDSLFYPVYLLYICLLIRLVQEDEKSSYTQRLLCYAELLVVAVFLCLIRNNGIYEVVLSLPLAILVVPRKERILLCGTCVLVPAIFFGIDRGLWPRLVDTDNVHIDRYTAQLQQTARYALYHAADVTQEERAVLDEILEYDRLAELYDPENGDLAKEALRWHESERGFDIYTFTGREKDYQRVWLAQGLKHPATYLQAWLNGCYGYFYPDRKEVKEGLGWYRTAEIFGYYELPEVETWSDLRERIERWTENLRQIPFVGMLYSCGFQTWLFLCCAVALFHAGRKGGTLCSLVRALVPCLPGFVSIMICTVSPIDAYLRYMLPILATLPVTAAWSYERVEGGC
ncbi:MAG: hypothetical protein IJT34_04680 [Butyrivibrio sp.]|nr:hypothetical protein [Butyrivibrio sp.]